MSSRRHRIPAVCGAIVALAGAAGAAGVASGAPSTASATLVDASATLSSCTPAATAEQRSAAFSAQVQAIPGTSTMSVSFQLVERTSGGRGYQVVMAPGFGLWQTSKPGIAVFSANEDVVDLPAPAMFRAIVSYRWLDRRHRIIRRAQRVTPVCVMPAPPEGTTGASGDTGASGASGA